MAQVATAEKSNEITEIPQVLDSVEVTDATVTIDVMGRQRAIAEKIVDCGGDYILPVKGNQDHLEQAFTEFFADHLEDYFVRVKVSHLQTTSTHHSRVERRAYIQVNMPANFPERSVGRDSAWAWSCAHARSTALSRMNSNARSAAWSAQMETVRLWQEA